MLNLREILEEKSSERLLPLPENKEPRYTSPKELSPLQFHTSIGRGWSFRYPADISSCQSMYALSFTCSIWGSMRTVSIADWLFRESQRVGGERLSSWFWVQYRRMPGCHWEEEGCRAWSHLPGGNGCGDRRWNCLWLYYFLSSFCLSISGFLMLMLLPLESSSNKKHKSAHPGPLRTPTVKYLLVYVLLPTKERKVGLSWMYGSVTVL